jgi:hypothetical protein
VHAESAPVSHDPRRNIIHKRQDITHCTNAESSLMKSSVDFTEVLLEHVIGGGGFGQVWKATWRSTPVAVKILTGSAQREICDKGILEEFAAEINMLKVSNASVFSRACILLGGLLWCSGLACKLLHSQLLLLTLCEFALRVIIVSHSILSFILMTGNASSKHLFVHGRLPHAAESCNHYRACSEWILVGCSETASVCSLCRIGWNDSRSLASVALRVACRSSVATKGHLAVGSCQASGMWCRPRHDVPSQRDAARPAQRFEKCQPTFG